MSGDRFQGTVKWFDGKKGYGFIARDDGEKDCFVHYSGIVGNGFRELREGQKVEFGVESSPKGPKAVEVVVLEEAA